jgi:hypothetical protein
LKIRNKCLLAIVCAVIVIPVARGQDASDSSLRTKEKAKAQEKQTKTAAAEKKLHEPFLKRLDEAFLEQLGTPAYIPPEPGATPTPRRIPPTPFDSPPFPSSDWQIGGSQIIRVSCRRIR